MAIYSLTERNGGANTAKDRRGVRENALGRDKEKEGERERMGLRE